MPIPFLSRSAALFAVVLFPFALFAQIPTKCFEIESILVDACISDVACPGSTEGMNEMVRFITGPDPIPLTDLQIGFYSSSFQGISQNATTAALTAELNATVTGCGEILEPPGGVIPAASRVIFITSTEMCVAANSFSGLNSTLYVIFQNAGNSQGHFKNNDLSGTPATPTPAAPLMRWFRMRRPSTNCGDTVTYNANELVNLQGTYGGPSEDNDGATATFSWPGTPTVGYINNGCQAPIETGVPVTITGDTTLCSFAETSVLTAHGADTYEWSTGQTGPTIVATITGPIEYWVVGTSACGSDTAFISVRWMNHTLFYTDVSCNGAADGELSLTGMGGELPYTYSWSTGSDNDTITGLDADTYAYTITDADGCTQSGSYTIQEPTPLVFTVGNDTTICPGDYAILYGTASGGTPGYDLTWSSGTPLVYPTETTTYSVVVTDQHGCTLPAQEMTVTVGGGIASFTASETEGCGPLCVTFTATSPGTVYDWQFGDNTTGQGAVVEHCYTSVGTFDVTLVAQVDGSDCASAFTADDLITVLPAPVASFSADPIAGFAPLDVQFTNATTPATASYDWDFGDQTGSTGTDPQHTYATPGVFMVVLEATSGCSDSDTLYITVLDPTVPQEPDSSWIFVPNIFTPNNDRFNDGFRVSSNALRSLEVSFFNRWGQLVGEIRSVGEVWDGRTPAGQPVSDGTYFFTLKAEGLDGQTYDLHGPVTVLR